MLTAADITQIVSYYDLGTVYSTSQATRGNMNETAFVQTNQGTWVVRRNHRRQSEAAQRYRHQFITQLYNRGVPVPPLMSTRDGDTLLIHNRRSYEIMGFIKGDEYNPNQPAQLESVGATLGLYHTVARDMPAPPDSPERRYVPQGVLALNEVMVRRDIMGDLTPMLSWYDLRAARLRKVLSDATYDALPHLVIHGDIHRDNFLFQDDQVVALLDYDQIAWDIPLADLADALVAFASVQNAQTHNWGVFQGPLDEDRAARLIEAYTRVAPLSSHEITLLPAILEVLWLQAELGRVFATPEGEPEYHLSVLEQGQALVTWLDEHRDSLTRQWLTIATGSAVGNQMIFSAA